MLSSRLCAIALCATAIVGSSQAQPPRWPPVAERLGLATGSGNFDEGAVSELHTEQLQILSQVGSTAGRVNIRPGTYLLKPKDWTQFNVSAMDDLYVEAWEKHGVKNLMLLVEFYSKFIDKFGIGTQSEWQKLGHDLAVHLGPGGTLAKQRGISDPLIGEMSTENPPQTGTTSRRTFSQNRPQLANPFSADRAPEALSSDTFASRW